MKIVVQRVSRARVDVEGETVASIGRGFLLLAAVERDDTSEDLAWCAGKVAGLRIFEDGEGKMNLDLHRVEQPGHSPRLRYRIHRLQPLTMPRQGGEP